MMLLDHYTEIAKVGNFSSTVIATSTFIHLYEENKHIRRFMHFLTLMLFFKIVIITNVVEWQSG